MPTEMKANLVRAMSNGGGRKVAAPTSGPHALSSHTVLVEALDELPRVAVAKLSAYCPVLLLDTESCNLLATGQLDIALLSAPLPDAFKGKPTLICELAPTPKHKKPPLDALIHIVGVGIAVDSAEYSGAQIAMMHPAAAGGGARQGVTVKMTGLSHAPRKPVGLHRVEGGGDVLLCCEPDDLQLSIQPVGADVRFTLAPVGVAEARAAGKPVENWIATFKSADGEELDPALCAHPITTRGGTFTLKVTDRTNMSFTCAFTSRTPRATAAAIAERLSLR